MPPPIPPNPSDIPTNLPKTTLVLSHFANLKLSGDRLVHDAVKTITTLAATVTPPPQHHVPRQRRRRVRRTRASSTRVHKMSDADLEAELAARRAARQRERDRYAKAIRSEKLTVLENELSRLRSELSRMDRTGGVGAGTPPTSRWEALPDRRNRVSYLGNSSAGPSAVPSQVPPQVPSAVPGAPPPPPPPAAGDDAVVDPEKRRREKEERQRRREAKRKEREANRKPLTLADIIKGAGPDPMKRLKPPGSIPVPDVHAPEEVVGEDIKGAKDGLKKVSRDESDEKEGDDEKDGNDGKDGDDGKDGPGAEEKSAKEGKGDGKDDETPESGKDEAKLTMEAEKGEPTLPVPDGKSGDDAAKLTKSTDKSEQNEISEAKVAENESPTKVSGTATTDTTSLTRNTVRQTQLETEAEPDMEKGAKEVKEEPAVDGVPNGTTVDALAALSKLKAKLPTADGARPPGERRRRVSVEEKRRLRRAAKKEGADGEVE